MNIKNKSIKHTAWVVALGYVLLTTLLYFTTINSDAYEVAVAEVRINDKIHNKIGEISDISLSPFNYRISTLGNSGHARFNLRVKGSNSKATVHAYMIREKGIWRLDNFKISGAKNF
jgi:hypothetical protein